MAQMHVTLFAIAIAGGTLFAQTQVNLDVKPGLWETTTTSQSSGMPPIDVSKLTPEQRARFEAALRAQQAKGAQTHTNKSCLTKEKLKDIFSDMEKGSDMSCKRTIASNTRSVADFKMECTDGTGRKTNGTLHVEAVSRESVKGTMKMSMGDGTR